MPVSFEKLPLSVSRIFLKLRQHCAFVVAFVDLKRNLEHYTNDIKLEYPELC